MIRKLYNNLEEISGSILLVAMCIVAVLQVASRYILREPFGWTEELCTFLFVWLVFIGASLTLKTNEHFAVEILVDKLPAGVSKIVKIFSLLLVLFFAILLFWFGLRLSMTGARSITAALEIPRTVPYSAVPFGALLMAIRTLERLFKIFKPTGTLEVNE